MYFSEDNPEFVNRYVLPGIDKETDAFRAVVDETTKLNRAKKNLEDDKEDVTS